MNTRHVPDLELCQAFDTLCKEKNITIPETEHVWVLSAPFFDGNHSERDIVMNPNEYQELIENVGENVYDILPAPLVSELGERLPPAIKVKDALAYLKYVPHSDKQTDVIYSKVGWFHQESDHKEANARIKMLNYLLAEGIITTL